MAPITPESLPSLHRRLEWLSWTAARAAAQQPSSTVIWPMGSLEQHGPHLPLGTDALFADRVVDAVLQRLPAELPIWRLPLQTLGFAPEHKGFAGTISLPASQLLSLVEGVGAELADCGFRRLVLLNGHGGQIALLEAAARQLRANQPGMAVLPCFLWRGINVAPLIPEPERSQGLHAGLAETSLMLHLAPELVGSDLQADGLAPLHTPPAGWSWEGEAPTAWLTGDISRSGVIGDPVGATAALGRDLFERLVAGWEARLRALLGSDWPPTQFRP